MAAHQEDRAPNEKARRSPEVYLRIYLEDHYAGSVVGHELAKRIASSNKGTEFGDYVRNEFLPELEEDQAELKKVLERLGASTNRLKDAVAWTGEKLGRFKLNGQLTGYSPLTRLIELEGLVLGVHGKASMWKVLGIVQKNNERLEGFDFGALEARANAQRDALDSYRVVAAEIAFEPR